MDAKERRSAILQLLRSCTQPVTGSELAKRMGVSRQVIVQDIALLRMGGVSVFATSEGYVMPASASQSAVRCVIAARHSSSAQMRKELELVVDMGGTVVDVSIEHPVYGEISAQLLLRSRMGVNLFMEHFESGETAPISTLTDGVHLHTLEAPNEEEMKAIVDALRSEGLLVE